ncbi:MAG: tetratricopeptide repeat protein [Pontiellaceae bacterium]
MFLKFLIIYFLIFISNFTYAQNVNEAGISELFSGANKFLQAGDFRSAIPYLQEAVARTSSLTDPQGKETCQSCRFELARAQFQDGAISSAMLILEEYLSNTPRKKESAALNLLATGFFDLQEWEKVELTAQRLLSLEKLRKEDEFDGNLFLGQALYRQEKWEDSVSYLEYAAENTKDDRTKRICNVMVVGALVKAEEWNRLYSKIPKLYRTDAKYDITLNLTLMQAGKSRYEDEDYLNALLLYRMVLPRNDLLDYTDSLVGKLSDKLQSDIKIGIRNADIKNRQNQIDVLEESKQALIELPPYENEVTFRIGSIYNEKKRYWEGFVLFDKLYNMDRNSEIGEAAMWQSVLILYDVGEIERAENRIIRYLEENPSGQYARSLLNLMMRDNYIKQEFQDVILMEKYVNMISLPDNEEDKAQQSDLHYLLAFWFFPKPRFF